jgi:hypothetical protein
MGIPGVILSSFAFHFHFKNHHLTAAADAALIFAFLTEAAAAGDRLPAVASVVVAAAAIDYGILLPILFLALLNL